MKSRSSAVVVFTGFLFACATGCSSAQSPAPSPQDDTAGVVGLDLTLPGGVRIDAVHYVVSNAQGHVVAQGNIDVRHSLVIRATLTLPAGTGYTMALSATSTDGSVTCSGTSAPFDVSAHGSLSVRVDLSCRTAGSASGVVTVSGTTSNCATLQTLTVNSAETTVGSSVALSATATAPDLSSLTFAWSAPSGTFSSTTSPAPTFTCTAPGPVAITLAVGDGPGPNGGAACGQIETTTVQCDPVPQGGMPCTDTQNDPNNCGTCGHGCGGGACVAGVCQPVALVTGVCPTSIAVDATNVYFTHDLAGAAFEWAVESVAKTGGAPTVLASYSAIPGQGAPQTADGVAVWGGTVYFVQWNPGNPALMSVPAQGGPTTLVFAPIVGGAPRQVARNVVANATGVYWANEEFGVAFIDPTGHSTNLTPGSVPVSGGIITPYPSTLAVDAVNAYFSDNEGHGEGNENLINSVPIGGGMITTIGREDPLETNPIPISDVAIASDGTCVYWATTDQAPGFIPIGPIGGPLGSGPSTLDPATTVTSLALDSNGVYWTENSSSGAVVFQPMANCKLSAQAKPLALGQSFPFAVAVDDTYVYWINASVSYSVPYSPTMQPSPMPPASCNGSVMRVAK
jgi:hypothetical protein